MLRCFANFVFKNILWYMGHFIIIQSKLEILQSMFLVFFMHRYIVYIFILNATKENFENGQVVRKT